jgi:hypothetical protein
MNAATWQASVDARVFVVLESDIDNALSWEALRERAGCHLGRHAGEHAAAGAADDGRAGWGSAGVAA